MRISQRLLSLVASALFGMVVLVSVNTFEMKHVYKTTSFATVSVIPRILTLNKAIVEFSQIRVHVYHHVAEADLAAMKLQEGQIQEARNTLEKILKEYEQLVSQPDDKQLLDADRNTLDVYMQSVAQITSASYQGKKDESRTLLNQGATNAGKLNAALVAHMDYNKELGKRSEAEATAAEKAATELAIGVTTATLLLVGLIGVFTYRHLITNIAYANKIAERIAQGHLCREEAGSRPRDEIGQLIGSMDTMRSELAATIHSIIVSANSVASSSEHLAETATVVANASQSQFLSTSAAASAVEELTVSIDHVGNGADDASGRAGDAGELAIQGEASVDGAANRINSVATQVEDTAQQMQRLSGQVQKIGSISTVIREVAEQTNLLALNAAIEAARAGEQGRGFAIVADEVRKLAERTTHSVQEIDNVIKSIQLGADAVVTSMLSSSKEVAEVASAARAASTSMRGICSATDVVRSAIGGISAALKEQQAASTELARSVESIAQRSEENANAVASISDTASELVSVSNALKNATSRFSIDKR